LAVPVGGAGRWRPGVVGAALVFERRARGRCGGDDFQRCGILPQVGGFERYLP